MSTLIIRGDEDGAAGQIGIDQWLCRRIKISADGAEKHISKGKERNREKERALPIGDHHLCIFIPGKDERHYRSNKQKPQQGRYNIFFHDHDLLELFSE